MYSIVYLYINNDDNSNDIPPTRVVVSTVSRLKQVTCFLAGLFSTDQAKCALVLAPKSVMRGWETELRKWLVEAACPTVEVT